MPPGFLGTRADLLVDLVLVVNTIAPLWAWVATRMAKERDFAGHKRLQLVLFVLAFLAVLALEGRIRFGGGSGSLVAGSPHVGTSLMSVVFVLHIGPAVATYILWAWLVVVSLRRAPDRLPGDFSRRHRRVGFTVLAGLAWTAISGGLVYYLSFVA
ncbi:MAG: DUF420 domain-containing protein [Planctomycetota bacterium]|jgi:uncharacterized membrane protein YozB (DUF420 family)